MTESNKHLLGGLINQRTLEDQTVNIESMGMPYLCAETPLILVGFKPEMPTTWIINRVEHVLDGQGYRTSLTAVRRLKGASDETTTSP